MFDVIPWENETQPFVTHDIEIKFSQKIQYDKTGIWRKKFYDTGE